MTLIKGRASLLQYGLSIRLTSKQVPMFQVVKTVNLCQELSGLKDVLVVRVTPVVFKVEIQHTIISLLIVWTRYILIINRTEGSHLNNSYHAMSGKYVTASCRAIL